MEDYKKRFIERTKEHIARVNKYASKLGHTFPHHDADKLQGELFEPYSLMCKYDQGYDTTSALSEDELKRYNEATLKHVNNNPHHPEYWVNPKLKTFDRKNPPHALNCKKMSESALLEMCCDWCAMSEEFGNSPFDWADKTIGERWIFTNDQIRFIYNTLDELWND